MRQINQSEAVANTLGGFNSLLYYVSVAIIGVLLLVSIFLINNTVTIGIAVRKEEIAIMKLIGATDSSFGHAYCRGRTDHRSRHTVQPSRCLSSTSCTSRLSLWWKRSSAF